MSEPVRGMNVYDALLEARPEAIVVYCSDPRFQMAFEAFLGNELGLTKGRFIPLVVAGGAGVLARPQTLPKEFKFMKDRLDLFCSHFPSLKRVVLINHEDCAYYRWLAGTSAGLQTDRTEDLGTQPRRDLQRIAGVFNRFLPHLGLSVELYCAGFADSGRGKVVFERILV